MVKIILGLILITGLLGAPAWARQHEMNPVPPGVAPAWTPVPQVPGVVYAPNLPVDLFRYQGSFYYYHHNTWSLGPSMTGPWRQIGEPPQVFYQIQAPYFKSPPSWARGKKTGWRGRPLPPGQMKKYEDVPLPPGQLKTWP